MEGIGGRCGVFDNDIKNGVFDDERILHISDMYETSSEYCKNLSF